MSNTTLILFVFENSPDILNVFGFIRAPDHPVLAPTFTTLKKKYRIFL
jgi:hypothetical protein